MGGRPVSLMRSKCWLGLAHRSLFSNSKFNVKGHTADPTRCKTKDNSLAIPVFTYRSWLIKWTKEEIEKLYNKKQEKPDHDADRTYDPRKGVVKD